MAVIGDFCGWVEPGVPMAKNADGKWEVAVKSTMDGVLKYKFWYKGTYIYDFKSPDKIDDGFGAYNGLVEVASVLAKQKAKELEASGDAAGAAALLASVPSGAKISFLTATNFDIETKFLTQGAKDKSKKGMDLNAVNFYTKAYSKFTGEIVPGVPVYAELALADGTTSFYNKKTNGTVDVKFKDAFKSFMNNTIAGPIGPWSNAGDKPMLGNFNFGVNTDYVNVLTGWKWAKHPKHNPIVWETIDGDLCAGHTDANGGGFVVLTNGSKLQNLGDAKVNVGLSTNKSADTGTGSKFGIYTFATVDVAGITADIQYSTSFAGDAFFDKADGHDIIFGAKGAVGPVSLAGQALLDMDIVNDKLDFTSKDMAYVAKADYASDIFEGGLKYQLRGANADLMYAEDDGDQLGNVGKQKISAYTTLKAIYGIDLKLEGSVEYANENANSSAVWLKPNAIFSLLDLVGFDATADVYANMNLTTGDKGEFTFDNVGMKVGMGALNDVVTGIDVYYGLVNGKTDMNNSLVARVKLPSDLNADVGFLLRSLKKDSTAKKEELNPVGFAVGVSKRFKAMKQPFAWAQFVWNMDPFKGAGDGRDNLNLDGYLLDGYSNFDGAAAFRMGIRWDI